MSTSDENAPKTDTSPLLDSVAADAQGTGGGGDAEPRPAGRAAMEEALAESGRSTEDLTAGNDTGNDTGDNSRDDTGDA